MRTRIRSFIVALTVTAATVTGGVAAAAPADAAPPRNVPFITVLGDSFGAFGDHDFCRGSINARLSTSARGTTQLTVTSFGFTGNGPGWRKNPRCRLLVGATVSNTFVILREVYFPVTFGTKPGEKVTRDISSGPGLRQLGLATYAVNNRIRVPQAYGTNLFYIAP